MNIRANLAMTSLEAFRLKPNYNGVSHAGMHYVTNDLGFRINPASEQNHTKNLDLLLGGDSRIFGYALSYQDTIAAMLESMGYVIQQQAFPGSSPAMFNEQIFKEGLYKRITAKPKMLIYGYDREDIWNDQTFRQELKTPQAAFSLRWIKLRLGGYFWGMCVQKARAFSGRSNLQPTWLKVELWKRPSFEPKPVDVGTSSNLLSDITSPSHKSVRSLPVSESEILQMKFEAEARGMRYVLMYLPRFLELLCNDGSMRDRVKDFCEKNHVEWLDFYQILMDKAEGKSENISKMFLDAEEGIHFSKLANQWIVEEISRRCGEFHLEKGSP